MTNPGVGIPYVVDGPPPIPPKHGLLQAAAARAPEVRIVPDTDPVGVERWGQGVQVRSAPTDIGDTWDECHRGSAQVSKLAGNLPLLPYFGAYTAYVPETCTSRSVFGAAPQTDWPGLFADRAKLVLAAVESAIVERELMTGRLMPDNPHLSDDTDGVYPMGGTLNSGAATNVANAIGLLELAIAQSGRAGVIHCTPAFVTSGAPWGIVFDDQDGVLRTKNGTLVIPGAGYAQALIMDASRPHGKGAPSGAQEWVYATGPIDVRRSAVFTNPENFSEALDRGTNTLTYRAERYYLVDWDTALHAAVLADRCQAAC